MEREDMFKILYILTSNGKKYGRNVHCEDVKEIGKCITINIQDSVGESVGSLEFAGHKVADMDLEIKIKCPKRFAQECWNTITKSNCKMKQLEENAEYMKKNGST